MDGSKTLFPSASGTIYFHVLGESYVFQPESAAGQFEIARPDEVEKSAKLVLEAISALPAGQPEVLLSGSPAVFFPEQ